MLMQLLRHGEYSPELLAVVIAWLIAFVVAITVHEFAHAKSAEIAGDATPRAHGRVTLNPVAHYDPIGSTLFLLFGFGWAKPVPVNPRAFRSPRRDAILVSLWGPLSNFITAALFALPVRLGLLGSYTMPAVVIMYANLMLGFFNLIPVGPLDGAHVLEGLLSVRANMRLAAFYQRNQMWLLLAVLIIFFVPAVGNLVFGVIGIPAQVMLAVLAGPAAAQVFGG